MKLIISLILMFSGCNQNKPHNHKYTFNEDKDIICHLGCKETLKCECGYTTRVKVEKTHHQYKEWKETLAPGENTEGTKERGCKRCSFIEQGYIPRKNLKGLFTQIVDFAWNRSTFDSIDTISINDIFKFLAKDSYWPEPLWSSSTELKDGFNIYYYYTIEDLDSLCDKYFNRKFKWALFNTNYSTSHSNYSNYYDSANKRIVLVEYAGGYGGPVSPSYKYKSFKMINENLYEIYYDYILSSGFNVDIPDKVTPRKIVIEFKEGKYSIISHTEKNKA